MTKRFAEAYSADAITNGLAARFWDDVDVGEPWSCWRWKKSIASHGYGQTFDGVTVRLAHRVAYVLQVGPIPAGMTVDHVCRVRPCCNPRHLRLLPNLANASDNGNARKTHCPRGHEYTAENTRLDGRGHRRCRACARERARGDLF